LGYGRGGWFPGYLSEMEYFPSHRIAVAIQFNTDNARGLNKGLAAYITDFVRTLVDEVEKKKAA
jgi:D-alanyl-D-alanine carboxypeptidase